MPSPSVRRTSSHSSVVSLLPLGTVRRSPPPHFFAATMGGGRDRARKTTRLPAALREELGIEDIADRSRHSKKPRQFSVSARKAARKEQRRAKHAARSPSAPNAERKATRAPAPTSAPAPMPRPAAKKPKLMPNAEHSTTKQVLDPISGVMKTVQAPKRREPTKLERMSGEPTAAPHMSHTKVPRAKSQVERDEDDEIAWLEYQLSRSKNHSEGDDVDGTLYLLTQTYWMIWISFILSRRRKGQTKKRVKRPWSKIQMHLRMKIWKTHSTTWKPAIWTTTTSMKNSLT